MGYLAIKDKNWGSVTQSKEPVTIEHLAELEKNMLKEIEALHEKLLTKSEYIKKTKEINEEQSLE
jgi:hypothetical protein